MKYTDGTEVLTGDVVSFMDGADSRYNGKIFNFSRDGNAVIIYADDNIGTLYNYPGIPVGHYYCCNVSYVEKIKGGKEMKSLYQVVMVNGALVKRTDVIATDENTALIKADVKSFAGDTDIDKISYSIVKVLTIKE